MFCKSNLTRKRRGVEKSNFETIDQLADDSDSWSKSIFSGFRSSSVNKASKIDDTAERIEQNHRRSITNPQKLE